MDTITISLPESLKTYIESQIADGHYASLDEYMLKLIQQDQKRRAKEHLDQLLLEGLDSLDRGEGIEATDEWWEQQRQLIEQLQQKRS